jgi:K(+)-stimulated pyrophosphate-energized sodium pump
MQPTPAPIALAPIAPEPHGGEANLKLPDIGQVVVDGALSGRGVLLAALAVCLAGLGFGAWTYLKLKTLPVHPSMRRVSELIFATCKAYLLKQGRFLLILWAFIAVVIVVYYKLAVGFSWGRVAVIIAFSLIGMGGSFAVAWFGIRVNTFANSRTATPRWLANRGRSTPSRCAQACRSAWC